ncbi:glycosyltransferase family 2 protein [Saccharicrinis sp. FJH54]|uniref:glycosyltransferase family 2 protein n=1 Tax=Saccharicrinis sp. FJH54 TaxID=3344665 RepID=UPI0035D4DC8F
MSEQPLITVFILNWNRKQYLDRVIRSIINQTYKNLEILFVDNDSSDGSYEYVKANYPNINAYKLDENYGCPYGRTLGSRWANGEFILYADDDGVLDKYALENAYNSITTDDRIGVVSGKVIEFTRENEITDNISIKPDKKILPFFHGGISMHRMSMYAKTGLYPPFYFYGGEEGYLSMNMLKNNYYVIHDASVVLWHEKKKNRNRAVELVNRQKNNLTNKTIFWPWIYLSLYVLKIIIKHPYQAFKYKVLLNWLKLWPTQIIKSFLTGLHNRAPLMRNEFKSYIGLSINTNKVIPEKFDKISVFKKLFFVIVNS